MPPHFRRAPAEPAPASFWPGHGGQPTGHRARRWPRRPFLPALGRVFAPGREAAFPAAGGSLPLAVLSGATRLRQRVATQDSHAVPRRVTAATFTLGMYLPRHFTLSDLAQVRAFVDAAQSADLVTFDGTAAGGHPAPGHLGPADGPAPADVAAARRRPVFGRAARPPGAVANDQWQTGRARRAGAGDRARAAGLHLARPGTRAPPGTAATVPTWNYETVHLTGPVTFHRDAEWLRDIVTRLTRRARGRPAPARGRSPTPRPSTSTASCAGIVGVEMSRHVGRGQAEAQPESQQLDRAGVVAGLRDEPGPGTAEIARLMAYQLAGDAD